MEELYVNIEDFGGKLDDPKFDNGPIINRALDFLSHNGGGVLTSKGNGTIFWNGVIDKPAGPDKVIFQFVSLFNTDPTIYDTPYQKRDMEIKELVNDLLTEYISEKWQQNDDHWNVEDITEMATEINYWKNRIDGLLDD